MQSKYESFKETLNQALLGIIIGVIAMNIMIRILDGLDKTLQSIIIVFVMFILSTGRGYLVRRYFNSKDQNER